jgi:hypothetical protein
LARRGRLERIEVSVAGDWEGCQREEERERSEGRTLDTSYLTTDEEPLQQLLSKGLMAEAKSHCCCEATPMFWKSVIKRLLAVADGGSEMVKATSWPDCVSASLIRPATLLSTPSRITTSCEASIALDSAKRGAGLFPYRAMYSTADSVSTDLGRSRRSLP